MHISVTKWCTVGYGTGALWDSRNKSIHVLFDSVGEVLVICRHPWLQISTKHPHSAVHYVVQIKFAYEYVCRHCSRETTKVCLRPVLLLRATVAR